MSLYYRASNAIWNGVRLLGLSSHDRVLFPSYHCGIELDAILKAGVGVKFYPVGRDAAATVESISPCIDRTTKALFVTHYLGFPQDLPPLVSLCRMFGLALIEDCAHALYSRAGTRPLGSDGDIAAFSFWKTVPIPFGGALLINRPDLPVPAPPTRPSMYETLRTTKKLIELRLMRAGAWDRWIKSGLLDPLAWAIRRANGVLSNDPWRQKPVGLPLFSVERARWGMPASSRWLLSRADEDEIVRKRREHYAALLDASEESDAVEPLFRTLPAGVCPLFFPVIADDPPALLRHFEAFGVGGLRLWRECHPAFPATDYEDAAFLKAHVVALPVHQMLTPGELERIQDGIRTWRRARVTAVSV